MSQRLTRAGYKQLVDENIAWLKTVPRTLERDHVLMILDQAVAYEYGAAEGEPPTPLDRLARQCVEFRDQLDQLIGCGGGAERTMIVHETLARDRVAKVCRYPWPRGMFVQGGEPEELGGVMTEAFVEVFPVGDGYLRGEGTTLAEAEDRCWEKYLRSRAGVRMPGGRRS